MNKHLAFVLLTTLYPFFKLVHLNAKVAAWVLLLFMKPMRKLFYYTFGEELNYENRNRN